MEFVKVGGDDVLVGYILERKGIKIIEYKKKVPYYFHDAFDPLSAKTLYPRNYYRLFKNKLKNYFKIFQKRCQIFLDKGRDVCIIVFATDKTPV